MRVFNALTGNFANALFAVLDSRESKHCSIADFPAPCLLGPKGSSDKVVLVPLVHVHKKKKTGFSDRGRVNRVMIVEY